MDRQIVDDLKREINVKNTKNLILLKAATRLLKNNDLLMTYTQRSFTVINKFLLGDANISSPAFKTFNPDETNFANEESEAKHKTKMQSIINDDRTNKISHKDLPYSPITPNYIKYLIQIDEVMRLSKYFSFSSEELYRGTIIAKYINMDCLNSWTRAQDVSAFFSSGTILHTTIPSRFPRINIDDAGLGLYGQHKTECEVLLPPCDFETTKCVYNNYCMPTYEVTLRPRSLAKVFLEKMKNPPANYPKTFINDPQFGYNEALKMLEDYVKNYVDKKIIDLGGEIVKELDDPEIIFESEQFEQN